MVQPDLSDLAEKGIYVTLEGRAEDRKK